VPKDIKEERLSLVVTFDAGPLGGKLQQTFSIRVRQK
jgi:hypothetical protein